MVKVTKHTPCESREGTWGSRGLSPLNLCIRWRTKVSYTPRSITSLAKTSPYLFYTKSDGLWSMPGKSLEDNIFPLPGIELRFQLHLDCNLVAIPTELSGKNLEAE
jgi:hypothetical protein